jgi:hypothetical protein
MATRTDNAVEGRRRTKSMSIQTILGANGVIGRELSRQLSAYTDRTRKAPVHNA